MNEKREQPEASFEELLLELETLVTKLESETISLDDSLELHTRATELIKICQTRLQNAEQHLQTLVQDQAGEWSEPGPAE